VKTVNLLQLIKEKKQKENRLHQAALAQITSKR
jgi:hypothetical protein